MIHILAAIGFTLISHLALANTGKLAPASCLEIVQLHGKSHPTEVYDHLNHRRQTRYIRPAGDRLNMLAEADVYVLVLPGLGATYSGPSSTFQLQQALNKTLVDSKNRPTTALKAILDSSPEFADLNVYSENIPIPGARSYNIPYEEFPDNESILAYAFAQLDEVRILLKPSAKVIVFGRSFGGTLAIEMNYLRPDLIDGLIPMSAVLPDEDSLAEATMNLSKSVEGTNHDVDEDWIAWGRMQIMQMQWIKDKVDPFKGTPTLFLQGLLDKERTSIETQTYAGYGVDFPHVQYEMVTYASHDVTSLSADTRGKKLTNSEKNKEKRKRAGLFVNTIIPFINEVIETPNQSLLPFPTPE